MVSSSIRIEGSINGNPVLEKVRGSEARDDAMRRTIGKRGGWHRRMRDIREENMRGYPKQQKNGRIWAIMVDGMERQ